MNTKRPWDQETGVKFKEFIEKNDLLKKKNSPCPSPVSWSLGLMVNLTSSFMKFKDFKYSFCIFPSKASTYSDIENKFPQPYPSLLVSWSHGESSKLKDFLKDIFIDLQPNHEQLRTPRDHETKRLGWSSRNLLKKMNFWKNKFHQPHPTYEFLFTLSLSCSIKRC